MLATHRTRYSTINYLIYIYVSINFIDTWFNALSNNFVWHCYAYQEKMKNIFINPTEIPTPTLEDFKRKWQTLLTGVGGEWYLDIMRKYKTPMNKPRLCK